MVKKLKIVDTSFNIGGPFSRKNVCFLNLLYLEVRRIYYEQRQYPCVIGTF